MEKDYLYDDIYDSQECDVASDVIESYVLDNIISEIDECFEIMWYISNGVPSTQYRYTQDIP